MGVAIFVDLDGTYTKTDLLYESFIAAIKANPLTIFNCLRWMLKGKAYVKYRLAEQADLDISCLPINEEFVSFLKEEKKKDRRVYLATASTEEIAKRVVKQNNLFDGYIASCGNENLKGHAKLEKIRQISPRFAYAGNDEVDFSLFEHAEESYLVNPTTKALKKSIKFPVTKTFDEHHIRMDTWIKQLRVHHWLKNLLIFVPLIVSGRFSNLESIFLSVIAFLAFSLAASSTYMLNDLLDLESDRHHPRKRFRPVAAGEISVVDAFLTGGALLVVAVTIAATLSLNFLLVLLAYLCLTMFYSIKAKRHMGMDVVALALLFTIRIIAGAAVLGVLVSFWLLAFSTFVFFSLALVKRCAELRTLIADNKNLAEGRGYIVKDFAVLESFGASSAMLSVFLFCLYINNNVLTNQYQKPQLLWLIVPGLCYWLIRIWIKTHRGEMNEDPIVFSLTDRGSVVTIVFCGLIAILAQLL